MHKFFVSKDNIIGNRCTIEGDDVKHIYKVLRLKEGEEISINNCEGKEYIGKLIDINKKEVQVEILKEIELNNESNIKVHLFQGMPKSTKMDLIVQKNTELGIRSITPVITERVVVKNDSDFKKVDRWNRIALEACKQSKRSLIPNIDTPIEFHELLIKLKDMDLIVVPYENKEEYGIKKLTEDLGNDEIKNIAIVIGPEGGFEEEEILKLEEAGAYIITLGPRILRTETAGFVALSLLMYELGDLGGSI
ncbi:MAG: 16S rRNA (uracil(1498)-N(3))-methyltransferase [Clostridium argentinense]|uniref:Ribosomal RNA small subunit methyltransferase E n=1 Tax=Clostridium faecium TaxID=2762223 RepID=A0ABR8YX65_9CLOT|nr:MULTISPECIES: 16S rRNA (uracil(1498)-N(3))-methyltransferase [Clostridium]MBD8048820.1 16S rRNA (uracil(1498)-N(3))-methyltransferase [Clostridium faecium]MBS5823944.1 16S rRNA (uracil(1498)-N(3))-methyltransferase [Clostridium argentinense]MDU1348335.1 16S rRNA (uracil(1498)-N(3))-methyltransferase [Clostridium argentinense]